MHRKVLEAQKIGAVGILTFHCADNYGAMLQAYGLKRFLEERGITVDIVPYEPPFMTGRHWWIPYIPACSFLKILCRGWNGWKRNIMLGKDFFRQRTNMRRFRKKYLIRAGQKRLFFKSQLRKLQYQCYIVGSDQIWNPDITLGLRKVYFGAFGSRRKKKVIAYAASLGGDCLSEKYDRKFSELLRHVNVISVRERAAIPYIKQFCRKKVCVMPDPVFLLKENEWKKIEKIPDRENFIFVYMTEFNSELVHYVKVLAKQKKLGIVQIKGGLEINLPNVIADRIAGPAEFLGYVHKADYIVTNSFHGVAFSIIYQKKFLVFQHSSLGERINNILTVYDMQDRVYRKGENIEIERDIEWERIREHTEDNVRKAENFLLRHIRDKKTMESSKNAILE